MGVGNGMSQVLKQLYASKRQHGERCQVERIAIVHRSNRTATWACTCKSRLSRVLDSGYMHG